MMDRRQRDHVISDYIWEQHDMTQTYDYIINILADKPIWTFSDALPHCPGGYLTRQGRELLVLLHKLGVRPHG